MIMQKLRHTEITEITEIVHKGHKKLNNIAEIVQHLPESLEMPLYKGVS